MTIAIFFIILLAVLALVSTIYVANDREKNYSKKTKGNVARLSLIYAVVLIISCVAVGVYIVIK
ncbi:hypothetical protein [Metabacillus fastidiosus]|uniref:hypothetical protein n=1 Tax=Metabacillus fastidiosus TaxID=1458 RepID=UPI003D2E3580